MALFDKLHAVSSAPGPHMVGLHERQLKRHLVALMAAGAAKENNPQGTTAKELTRCATAMLKSGYMSDRVFGLKVLLESASVDAARAKLLEEQKAVFAAHPDSLEMYIGVIASLDCEDAHKQIEALVQEPFFNMALAGHSRTVARGWAANRKRSLLTAEGLALTIKLFVSVGKVNQMSSYAFLQAFGDVAKFDAQTKARLVAALQNMQSQLEKAKQESLYNNISRILAAANPAPAAAAAAPAASTAAAAAH